MSKRPASSVQTALSPMRCTACRECEGNGSACIFGGPFVLSRDPVCVPEEPRPLPGHKVQM